MGEWANIVVCIVLRRWAARVPLFHHPQALEVAWADGGGYDGLLGFSNGAAAAFLVAVWASQETVGTTLRPVCPSPAASDSLLGFAFWMVAGGRPPLVTSYITHTTVCKADCTRACMYGDCLMIHRVAATSPGYAS